MIQNPQKCLCLRVENDIMFIRKKNKLEDLWHALQGKYGDIGADSDFAEKIMHTREGKQALWTLRLTNSTIEAACLTEGSRATDFHCNCEQFETKKYCKHLYRLIDLVLKNSAQKLHPTPKRERQSSLNEDITRVLQHTKSRELNEFIYRHIKHFDDFGLLLITSQLKNSKDIAEEVHWIRLKSLFSDRKRTLKKEAILLRHLNEIKRQIEELIQTEDIKTASFLYAAFAQNLISSLYNTNFKDQKAVQLLNWFEGVPALLIHYKMAPALQVVIRQIIADTLLNAEYLANSSLKLFQLPAIWLPEKIKLTEILQLTISKKTQLLDYPVMYFIFSVFCGLENQKTIKIEEQHIAVWLDMCRQLDPVFGAHKTLFTLLSQSANLNEGLAAYVAEYSLDPEQLAILAQVFHKVPYQQILEKISTNDQESLKKELLYYQQAEGLYLYCSYLNITTSAKWINNESPESWQYLYPLLPDSEAQAMLSALNESLQDYLNTYLGEQNQSRVSAFFQRLIRHGKEKIAQELLERIEMGFDEKKQLIADIKSQLRQYTSVSGVKI
jgi:hypothetical protein